MTGAWDFNSDKTRIIFDKGSSEELTLTIAELTANKLKVTFTAGGTSYEITWVPV